MLPADDINVGDFVTVLNGVMVPSAVTPYGELRRELHYDLKGVPLAVVAVDIPYVMVAIVPSGSLRLLDVREAEFMRCSDTYAREFREHLNHVAELARVNPSQSANH